MTIPAPSDIFINCLKRFGRVEKQGRIPHYFGNCGYLWCAASILLGMIVIFDTDTVANNFALLFAAYLLADEMVSVIAAWTNQAERTQSGGAS